MIAFLSTSGTSPLTIRSARPSAIAVLPTPGIADEQRVVLGAPAEDLDGALDLGLAADQHVDLALAGLRVEVGAVGAERLAAPCWLRSLLGLLGGTTHATLLRQAWALGDAVG